MEKKWPRELKYASKLVPPDSGSLTCGALGEPPISELVTIFGKEFVLRNKELIFSFDTGLQSGGEAIRYGDSFLYAASNELDESYGSIENDQTKRRLKRQRFNYHARIDWLNQQCLAAGLPVYHNLKRVGKYKYIDISTLEDKKIMSSSVIDFDDLELLGDHRILRVYILEGKIKELEPWQIYIALHGAIRKRGYQKVSWANYSERELKGEKEAKKENSPGYLKTQFEGELQTLLPDEKYQFTCYYELVSQGLWNFDTKTFVTKVDYSSLGSKTGFNSGYTCSREIVYRELRILLNEVKKVFPNLDVDLTLYGPCKFELKNDADLKRLVELNFRNIYEREVLGVLGQKIPRFDNRIISKCSIFPHLNVVRKDDPLAVKFHYYFNVFNHRFMDQRTGEIRRLTPSELHTIVDYCLKCKFHAEDRTEKSLTRILSEIPDKLQLETSIKNAKLALPRTSGRSRFSRPALYFLIEFFRRGDAKVLNFYNWCLAQPSHYGSAITIKNNSDILKGLREIDFFWLKKWAEEDQTWYYFRVPNVNSMISKDPETKYREILRGLKHPLIRQRAILFRSRLKKMAAFSMDTIKKQVPDKIVIEFVREDFSQKRKSEENTRINELTKKNKIREGQLLECIKDLKESEQNVILKKKRKYFRLMRLAEEQDYIDLFNAKKINPLDIMNGLYDEAHIVPASQRGTGEVRNLILMRPEQNREQKNRTFYEWLSPLNEWTAFKKRVNRLEGMPPHKKELLMSVNPREIFESKQGLNDTSFIASAFKQIADLEFGWTDGKDAEGSQRVFLVRGKITGWFRRVLGLNKLLNTSEKSSDSKTLKSQKKKREKDSDAKNHGLDAMCLSYLANIKDMKALEDTLNTSEKVSTMKHQISIGFREKLFVRRLTKAKGNIEDNFMGIKRIKNSPTLYVVRKHPISEIAYTMKQQNKVFDLEKLPLTLGLNEKDEFNPKIFTKVFTDLRSKYPKDSQFKKAIFSEEEGCPIYIELRKLYEELTSKNDAKDTEAAWVKGAGNFQYKDGTSIKVLKKITLIEKVADGPELEDVKELKYADGSSYGIRTKGSHIGYIIYKNEKNKECLDRIYAYEGQLGAKRRLNIKRNFLVLQTGDWIKIKNDVDESLKAGSYKLKTISRQNLIFDDYGSKSVRHIGLNNIEKIEYPIP